MWIRRNSGFSPIIILLIVILALVGSVGYYLNLKDKSKEAANWKTITGNGYSILIPPNFSVKSDKNTDTVHSGENEKVFSVRIENTLAKDTKEYAKGILFTKPTKINEYEAIEILNDVPKVPFESYVLVNNGFAYRINNEAVLDSDPKNDVYFGQILSTFQFLK